jgi:Ca-activated chloride channel family protein
MKGEIHNAPFYDFSILDEDTILGGGTQNESYSEIIQNTFLPTEEVSSQAFSLKVDTAAYSNIARYINNGTLPPVYAVRTEELINYFDYDEKIDVNEEHPFGVKAQVYSSPFAQGKYMAYVRVRTPDMDRSELPPSNLTFLIDTSGSMASYNKLNLLQRSFEILVENLNENDVVSIVTYCGDAKVVLDSAEGNEKEKILEAINGLSARGSTAGQKGIQTAYQLAEKNFREGANNRVILATDGDFNVGISSVEELKEYISTKRNSGVYFSALGFGTGNLKDDTMETLAANGNGNYSYIDNINTAKKVLVDEMGSNLFVVANDVKAELQFNPETVKEFRLVGYENRKMSTEDFDNASKDAGEIGVGSDVIVLVELVLEEDYKEGKLLDVCIRYKTIEGNVSKEYVSAVEDITETAGTDFLFAYSVASFAELLRKSDYIGEATAEDVLELAESNLGIDEKGYRTEFLNLITQYSQIEAS